MQRTVWLLIAVAACGGGTSSPVAPPDGGSNSQPIPPSGAVVGAITANHPAQHYAVITQEQLKAGGALELDIKGDAFHSHTLSLSSNQVKQIAGGTRVSQASSVNPHSDGSGAHSHVVTFN